MDTRRLKLRLDAILSPYRGGGISDSTYLANFSIAMGERDAEQESARRAAYLARYGRQNMQQWDDVPLPRIYLLLGQLIGIIKEENALSNSQENGG